MCRKDSFLACGGYQNTRGTFLNFRLYRQVSVSKSLTQSILWWFLINPYFGKPIEHSCTVADAGYLWVKNSTIPIKYYSKFKKLYRSIQDERSLITHSNQWCRVSNVESLGLESTNPKQIFKLPCPFFSRRKAGKHAWGPCPLQEKRPSIAQTGMVKKDQPFCCKKFL